VVRAPRTREITWSLLISPADSETTFEIGVTGRGVNTLQPPSASSATASGRMNRLWMFFACMAMTVPP
jgi:hypothetical protein